MSITITAARAFGAAIVLIVRNILVRPPVNAFSRFRRVGCAIRTIVLASRLFPLLALSVLAAPAFAATSNVGATAGSFAVSPTGAAAYTLPIAVPPGVNGMQPALALAYNSQGGNSLAGMGWGLAGLSAVHRCAATIEQDGVKGGVNLDANDRLCHDGQRLVPLSGSSYWAASEYRTEIETYTRIMPFNGGYRAWTKAGQIIDYGATDNARQQGATGAVISWAMNQAQDRSGNYLTVTYNKNPATGEHYPQRINYTGNTNTGLAANRAVVFGYEGRSDIETAYVGGAKTQTSVRLNRVQTFFGAALVREYRLAYGVVSAATGRSRLVNLQECAGDGVCLGATQLVWQEGSLEFATGSSSSICANGFTADGVCNDGDNHRYIWYPELNGDGRADLCYRSDSGINCRLGTGNGNWSATLISTGICANNSMVYGICNDADNWDTIRFVDLNGDGRQDLVYRGDQGIQTWSSTGGGFVGAGSSAICANGFTADGVCDGSDNHPYIWYPDLNGDSRADLCYRSNNGIKCRLGTGNGAWDAALISTDICANNSMAYGICNDADNWSNIRFVDLNGDGRQDLVYRGDQGIQTWLSTGSGFAGAGSSAICANGFMADGVCNDSDNHSYIWYPDLNGDGRADLCYRSDSGIKCRLGTGNGAWDTTLINTDICANNSTAYGICNDDDNRSTIRFADLDGDGKQDLVYRGDQGVQGWVSRNSGFAAYFSTRYCANGSGYEGVCNDADNWQTIDYVDFSGDGKADLIYRGDGGMQVRLNAGLFPDILTSLTTALGAQTTITYKPLTDPFVYTRENTAAYPVMDLQAPMYVVASHSASNGIGGLSTASYTYAGAKVNQTGRGFLGFRSVTTTGPDDIRTTSYYHQGYPYTGLPQQVVVKQPNGALRSAVNTWAAHNLGGGRYFPYVASSTESAWELDGAALPTVTTTGSYDLLGNATAVTSTASDGHRTSTANTYNNDTGTWMLGQLTQAQVTRTLPGGQSLTRTSTFGYDSAGRLLREVIEPNTVFTLATDYGYDAYGHRSRATVSGADIAARTTATDYLTSPSDPYPQIRTTNALGHTEVQTLDARYGAPVRLTGPNGLSTTWAYDGFGRKVQENRADGTATAWSLGWCPSAACPSSARYLATSQSSGSAPVSVYYDTLGREVRSHSQGFNGQAVYKDTQYDTLGRLQYASQPYFAGGASYWGVISYDLLGRPVTETAPSGATTRTSYQGLTTVVTNALNQTATRVKNSQGQLIQSIDALGNTTRYSYDPFGNLTQTVDPKSNIATLTYDIRGRKRSMTDPDMGYWEYKYNALGELTYQMDAKSQIVTLEYDLLGRMIKRVEKEGISTWAYDTAAMGKGKLAQVTGPNGYKQTHVYDGLGRPVRVSTFIDSATVPYDMDTGYDAYGRVGSVAYPRIAYPNGSGTRFIIYNTYNPQGYLSEVKNAATGQSYWKADVMDATGHLLAETLGNGLGTVRTYNPTSGFLEAINTGATIQSLRYTYDSIGNLKSRADAINSVTETFGYDALNRLTSVSGPAPKTYAYDSIGNITSKSDVGTYSYGAKPHAVSITVGAVNASYGYDANGNMTSASYGNNNARYSTYTSFNKIGQFQRAGSGSVTGYVYDAYHERMVTCGSNQACTVYLNPYPGAGTFYEKVVNSHTHYIHAGATPVAIYTLDITNPTPVVRYLHKDHLGSIDAITNATGAVAERFSYDAFGKLRLTNGQDSPSLLSASRGYTGHEHYWGAGMGLINMNGRVYDPSLARFISADPYIHNPSDSQELNRYSYVTNNPLKYTDPTGYKKFWKNITFNNIKSGVSHVTQQAVRTVGSIPYVGNLATIGMLSNPMFGSTYGASTEDWKSVVRATATAAVLAVGVWAAPSISALSWYGNMGASTGMGYISGYTIARINGASDGQASAAGRTGAWYAAAINLLQLGVTEMREQMVAQSRINPINASGESVGFRGDGFKLGGCRYPCMEPDLFGGIQGQKGYFLGSEYAPGSFRDLLVETYAGPHDFLNSFMYNAKGNLSVFYQQGVGGVLGDTASYFNVLPATVFAAASVVQPLLPYVSPGMMGNEY